MTSFLSRRAECKTKHKFLAARATAAGELHEGHHTDLQDHIELIYTSGHSLLMAL